MAMEVACLLRSSALRRERRDDSFCPSSVRIRRTDREVLAILFGICTYRDPSLSPNGRVFQKVAMTSMGVMAVPEEGLHREYCILPWNSPWSRINQDLRPGYERDGSSWPPVDPRPSADEGFSLSMAFAHSDLG